MPHDTSASTSANANTQWMSTRTPEASGATGSQARYQGSRFSDVWRAVSADPYDALPDKRLGLASVPELVAKGIYRAARRTLASRADLLPAFDKLVHPVGICLRGVWTIDTASQYTGLFKAGAQALVIARASDAMGERRAGKLRFLGLAAKLFPTADPEHANPLPTANLFTLENLAGSHTKCFLQALLSTDLMPLRPQPGVVTKTPLAVLAGPAFMLADRALSPRQPMIRQLYPLAELGEWDRSDAIAPAVMRLVPSPRSRRVETNDLREELRMEHHPDGVRYDVEVADHRSLLLPGGFRRIGSLHFTQSVASYSGDHRLHFAHPPYRHFQRHR